MQTFLKYHDAFCNSESAQWLIAPPPSIDISGAALKHQAIQRAMSLFRVLWNLSGKF
jgi:hypothetical protein